MSTLEVRETNQETNQSQRLRLNAALYCDRDRDRHALILHMPEIISHSTVRLARTARLVPWPLASSHRFHFHMLMQPLTELWGVTRRTLRQDEVKRDFAL